MAKVKDPAATADKVVRESDSRNPTKIARLNGILIRTVDDWEEQSGAYIEMMRQPIIYVAGRLDSVKKAIVIAHELGHHFLHRKVATQLGGFREFKIFDMALNDMDVAYSLQNPPVHAAAEKCLSGVGQPLSSSHHATSWRSQKV